MADDRSEGASGWPRGFDAHTMAQRRRLAWLPMSEKLKWLEEAHEVVRMLGRSRGEAADDESPQG